MDVSIIIVNYNTYTITSNCIESVIDKTQGLEYEIILIDNASKDESRLHFIQDKRITYKYLEKNIGFGMANNLGVQYAKGEFLFFLNSDTLLLNNAIKYFVDYWRANEIKHIGCLGSYLLSPKMEYIHSYGNFPTFTNVLLCELCRFRKRYHRNVNVHSEKNVDYITGADLFISKKNFLEIGQFSSHFFMYYEETYLQYLLSLNGKVRTIIEGPRIIHLEGASYTSKISNRKRCQIGCSLYIFWSLYYNRVISLIYKFLYLLLRFPVIFSKHYSFAENRKYLKTLLDNTL